MSPSHHNTVGGPLQDLPHAIVKAQRCPVQGAIDLTPVQPRPEPENKDETVGLSFKNWGNITLTAVVLEEIV